MARLLDDGALAAAGGACLADLEDAAAGDHDAASAACAARHALGAGRDARAVAVLAFGGKGDVYGPFAAEDRLVEVDFEAEGHVLAARGGVGVSAALAAAASAEEVAEPAVSAAPSEEVAEHGEDVVHAHAAGAEPAEALPVHAGVSELVVALALLGVVEDVVRLGGLLELLLSGLVARVAVRVVLHGELAVCGLDFVRRGRLGDAEHLVVVALVSHFSSPARRLNPPAC